MLVVLISGCGQEAGDNGQDYTGQIMEATIPETAMPVRTNQSMPPLNSGVLPVRIVAKNVQLEKENIGGMSETELAARLVQIAAKTDIPAQDAQYNVKTWIVKKEKAGRILNIGRIKKEALTAGEGRVIKYSYLKARPALSAVQLKKSIKQVARYSTPILDRDKSRVKNIRLAAKKIDKKIIMPGQEFSFNKATGRRTKKMGYEDATVIINTPAGPKHAKAPGGGVCQLSTTIYNAALKCRLNVTERHEHSDDVYYVADGMDATVTYNGADLKFVNNRKNPIMLRVYVGNRTVRVKIFENGSFNIQEGTRAITQNTITS